MGVNFAIFAKAEFKELRKIPCYDNWDAAAFTPRWRVFSYL